MEPDNSEPHKERRNPEIKAIKVPSELPGTFWHATNKYQFWYSMVGLVVGAAFALGGVVLLLHGVFGKTSWSTTILGAQSNVSDAPAGSVFAIVGLLITFVTRYSVKSSR